MTHEMIYWITRLDPINTAALAGSVVFAFTTLLGVPFLIAWMLDDDTSIIGKLIGLCSSLLIVSLLFLSVITAIFVPTTKEAAVIYVIPKIANSETMKEVDEAGRELVKIARDYVKEMLNTKKEQKND